MRKRIIQIFMLLAFTFLNMDTCQALSNLLAKSDVKMTMDSESIDSKLDEEFKWLRAEAKAVFVITASRVKEDIRKAASSVTVITEEQIRQMGARYLMDVLRTVPGMTIGYMTDSCYHMASRGMGRNLGQDFLIMINSHSLNNSFFGGAVFNYDTMVVDNIERIEIIRGPGSAMYGANAFSGVINIITKKAKDIDGYQVTTSAGSYNTRQHNFLLGRTWNDIGITFNFNYFKTDGFEPYITRDTQTGQDEHFGTEASLAPGHSKADQEKYDISLNLEYKGLKFDGKYVDRERKPLATPNYNVNKESFDEQGDYYLNLSYEGNIGEDIELMGKIYRNLNKYEAYYYRSVPRGAIIYEPDPDSPSGYRLTEPLSGGVSGLLSNKNSRTGMEIQTTYKMSDSNMFVGGITYEKTKLYDSKFQANYLYTPSGLVVPLSSIQDLTEIQNYINEDEAHREFKALFIQNLWDITDDVRLTLGARYDDYSDFGGSFNPRAGLVWGFLEDFNLKLIYGRAFRAPSFYELYMQNNPAVMGYPDLEPETVDTYEISLGIEQDAFSARLTGFHNTVRDSINIVRLEEGGSSTYALRNSNKLRSQGFEAEMKYDFGKGTYLSMNYTYQDAKNLDSDTRFTIARHVGNLMANIRLTNYFNLYTDFYFQKDRSRIAGDDREDPPDFGIVNTTLIAKNFFKGLEIRGSVYNIFDKEYVNPMASGTLPNDLPMPGRSFILELQYKF